MAEAEADSADAVVNTAMFTCKACDFTTNKRSNFNAHVLSSKHSKLLFLQGNNDQSNVDNINTSDNQTPAPETEFEILNTAVSDSAEDADRTYDNNFEAYNEDTDTGIKTDWQPFQSKTEMLCYILMNSSTHPLSEEVVKFILFILKESGVSDVPSLARLKEIQIGNWRCEDMLKEGTDSKGIPYWIIKPSELVKLQISNPTVSDKVIRMPRERSSISHPADAEKWQKDISFNLGYEHQKAKIRVPINLFLDDTSTHKSKRWLPLHCIQMQLSGLPLKERMKQPNNLFIGASEKTEIMDLGKSVIEDLEETERDNIIAYDAYSRQECIVKPSLDVIVADFAMMSHCTNHLGAAATKYCPICYADAEHFDVICDHRDPQRTQRHLDLLNIISSNKEKSKLRKENGVKEHTNCFWGVINPHRDIPIGILHLIPLGLAKHLVKHIIGCISDEKIKKLAAHIEAHSGNRFTDFFMHIDSRQGKDFKDYLQIAPFNMKYAGVPQHFVKMISCLSLIQLHLNMEEFSTEDLADLKTTISTYHRLIREHAPELKKKAKTHLLLHIVDDIKRHGPPVAYQEDAFEKNHGTIRDCIFQQNQKARSRDTGLKFLRKSICDHILSGGYYKEQNEWKCASPKVLDVAKSKELKKFIGRSSSTDGIACKHGMVSKLTRTANRHPMLEQISNELISLLISGNVMTAEKDSMTKCKAVTVNQDLANCDDWIEYENAQKEKTIGIFKEGLLIHPKKGETKMVAIMRKAEPCKDAPSQLGCNKFTLTPEIEAVSTTHLKRKVEMVHDCHGGNCFLSERRVRQKIEQKEVWVEKVHLVHNLLHKCYFENNYVLRDLH